MIQHYIQSLQKENNKNKDETSTTKVETVNEDVDSSSSVAGIMLKFQQSSTGEPRMVFLLDFVQMKDIGPNDEG